MHSSTSCRQVVTRNDTWCGSQRKERSFGGMVSPKDGRKEGPEFAEIGKIGQNSRDEGDIAN